MPSGTPKPGTVLCVAHRKNGDPCKRPPIKGARVCRFHGGAAPQVKHAAKVRLENAADRMARELLRMAEDPDLLPAVKLAAIRDALDRAGMAPNAKHDVTLEVKPYQKILDRIGRDMESDSLVIEGEVVDEHRCASCGKTPRAGATSPPGGWPTLCKGCRESDDDGPDLDDEYAEPDYKRHQPDPGEREPEPIGYSFSDALAAAAPGPA